MFDFNELKIHRLCDESKDIISTINSGEYYYNPESEKYHLCNSSNICYAIISEPSDLFDVISTHHISKQNKEIIIQYLKNIIYENS